MRQRGLPASNGKGALLHSDMRMNSWQHIKEKIKKAPHEPGIYIFSEQGKPLYIGKASNLRNRLRSYLQSTDFKTERLQENATDLVIIRLRSEIEALIEEARLIKKFNPPYNILWRDDKSYFYVAITKEKFPRIFVVHKKTVSPKPYTPNPILIGPFTEGRALRLVLRILRRTFPYCTCLKSHLRLCLNAQIGNCFGFCCRVQRSESSHQTQTYPDNTQTELEAEQARYGAGAGKIPRESAFSPRRSAIYYSEQKKRYQKNIRLIKQFLLGKKLGKFGKNLKPEEQEAFDRILAHREFLDYQTRIYADNTQTETEKSPRGSAFSQRKSAFIEGYDISHLAGRETVAGMTAWSFDGKRLWPRKEFWRKFIIKSAKPADDPAAIAETVSRRLNHPEWPYPALMIIDGGVAQFAASRASLKTSRMAGNIKIISFAKPGQLVYGLGNPKPLSEAPPELQTIIPRVIAETHNFAIRFHRARRSRSFLDNKVFNPSKEAS